MDNNPDNMNSSKPALSRRLIGLAFGAFILSAGLILLVWLGWIVLPWVALPPIIEPRVRELGRLASWSSEITGAVTIIAVVAAVFCFRRLFTRNSRQQWTAIAGLAALAVTYLGVHAYLRSGHLFDPEGKPAFYWGLTPEGSILRQSEPGLNPYTQRPLLPASSEYLALIRTRLREPLKQVDPATVEWFDKNTAFPLLWYYRNPKGQCEFYVRPAFHPRYRAELQPVTVELLRQWEEEQAGIAARAAAAAREKEARRQAEENQRAAEKKQRLEMERLRLENVRAKAEEARREQELAAARMAQDAEVREKAIQAEREEKERAVAQENRRREILARRAHEATAPVNMLEVLEPSGAISHLCPGLSSDTFQAGVFDDEYFGRRFRYPGRVSQTKKHKDDLLVSFEPITIGRIHFWVQAILPSRSGGKVKQGADVTVAGTVSTIRFSGSSTNIHGISAEICTIELGGAEEYRWIHSNQTPKTAKVKDDQDVTRRAPHQPQAPPSQPASVCILNPSGPSYRYSSGAWHYSGGPSYYSGKPSYRYSY